MSDPAVVQILVGGQRVGVIGLMEALESAAGICKGEPDDAIEEMLLSKLSKSNYIPETIKDRYRAAFLREYKRFVGEPVEEEGKNTAGLHIRILGPGCPNCEGLAQTVLALLGELGLPADVEHVRDPLTISEYKVFGLPALVVNGDVKFAGNMPSKTILRKMLSDAAGS